MATIGIDATYSAEEKPYGIARYSLRLMENLFALPCSHRFVLCYRLSRLFRRKPFTPPSGKPVERCFIHPPLGWRLKSKLDLFHSLAQRPPPFRFRREVVTVHDVFPLTGKDYSTPGFQRAFSALLTAAVERAARIITPSEFTARELEKCCPVSRERIRVIPEGVDPPRRTMTEREKQTRRRKILGGEGRILLHVGAIQTRKNIVNCLRALPGLPKDCCLVLAGGDGHGSEAVYRHIRRNGLSSRVRVLGYVPQDQVEELYQIASLLLFPSREEGFGLPVLEAMSHSLPAVISSSSALPEVGGDAALYVNPEEVEDITRKVSAVLEDPSLREKLVSRGLQRIQGFSWKRTAESTLQVYEELLGAG